MTLFHSRLFPALGLLALACTLPAPAMRAQESRLIQERPVLVWHDGEKRVIKIEAGPIRRGFLGVNLLDLTPELRRHFSVPADRGVMISRVLDGSPAQRAGLQPADILTEINGEAIPATLHLSLLVARGGEGDTIELDYWRDGRESTVSVALDVHERSQFDISPLLRRHITIETPRAFELQRSAIKDLEIDHEWIETIVGAMGKRFSESSFLEQLSAMRRERTDLHEKLEHMEERLRALESELHRLDGESE
ncbi:MAG: PDZ domain-containing protein [Acidobacteria bacterium]|nr:PDZ domain-containing protein [Acidobacteriota bacterium]